MQITALSELPDYKLPVKLGVVGSREFADSLLLSNYLVFLGKQYDIRYIVSGGKRKDGWGVDTLAENYADTCRLPKIIYPPAAYSTIFFHARNQQIANTSTILFAVKDRLIGGTLDTVKRMLALGKPVLHGNYKGEITWVKSL